MLTTYFRTRIGNPALLKRTLTHIQSAQQFSTTTPDYNKEPLCAEIDLQKVDAFGKQFYWNQSNFNKLDQQAILLSKDDDDKDKDAAPKGFEKFFKKKEQRDSKKDSEDDSEKKDEPEGKFQACS